MLIGKISGTVVCSTKNDSLSGSRYLLVEKCDQNGKCKNDFIVALDLVGAGKDELVMVSEGSSARETPETSNKPLDAIIVGIIDLISEKGEFVYKK